MLAYGMLGIFGCFVIKMALQSVHEPMFDMSSVLLLKNKKKDSVYKG